MQFLKNILLQICIASIGEKLLLQCPVTDTWQDEMYDNEEGHTKYYGLPYMVSEPENLADQLKCFPFCEEPESDVIVTKVPAKNQLLLQQIGSILSS